MKSIKIYKKLPLMMVTALIFMAVNPVKADSYYWVGGHSTSWSDKLNWTVGLVSGGATATDYPGDASGTDDVVISAQLNEPVWDGGPDIGSLVLESNSNLTCVVAAEFYVNGDITINSGATMDNGGYDVHCFNLSGDGTFVMHTDPANPEVVVINGDMTISGLTTYNAGGTLIFAGTVPQVMNPGNSGSGYYEFDSLEIDNTSGAGVTVSASYIQVDKSLEGSGRIQTGTTEFRLYGNLSVNDYYVGSNAQITRFLGHQNYVFMVGLNSANKDTFYDVDDEADSITLNADVRILHSLNFAGNISATPAYYGNIWLGNSNLIMAPGSFMTWNGVSSPQYSDATMMSYGYVLTSGTGTLNMAVSTNGTLFPVGVQSGLFEPVTLTASSGTPVEDVRVRPGVTSAIITQVTARSVNYEWIIIPENAIGQDFFVTTHWGHAGDELPFFNRTNAFLLYRTAETNPTDWNPFGGSYSGTNTDNSSGGSGTRDSISGAARLNMSSSNTFYIATSSDPLALPVTLVNFNATYNNGSVDLAWTTASEINNNYFDIERAVNGYNWESIGQAEGHGTSMVTNNYFFTDNLEGVVPEGTLYYRLKQVDYNGNFTYSIIRPVNFSSSIPDLAIYPNPSGNTLNVSWNNTSNDPTTLRLMNITGITLYQEIIPGVGKMQRQLDISSYANGTYLLQVASGTMNPISTIIQKN